MKKKPKQSLFKTNSKKKITRYQVENNVGG